MRRNPHVPIVNNAGEEVTFERQTAGNAGNRGLLTLQPGETYFERGVNLTYETLVLKDRNGEFTDQLISMDDLADDHYEKIEVTREFNIVKHKRKNWTQKITDFVQTLRSRPRGDTLPT